MKLVEEVKLENLDKIKEELMHRGCTPTQVNSKTLITLISAIEDEPELLNLHELLEDLKKGNEELERVKRSCKEYINYIEKFNKSLLICDTEEQRDCMKTAQFFINNIKINTDANNTAYITGLANILTGKSIPMTEKLKNTKKGEV